MTEKELRMALAAILPTARTAFTEEMELPYIIFLPDRTTAVPADDTAAARRVPWRVEVYSARLIPETYRKIEAALEGMGLIWDTDEALISDDKTMVKYYFFEAWEDRND